MFMNGPVSRPQKKSMFMNGPVSRPQKKNL